MNPKIQVKLDKYQKCGNIISLTSLLSSYTGSETDADLHSRSIQSGKKWHTGLRLPGYKSGNLYTGPFQDKELILQASINSCSVSLVNVQFVVLATCQINQHYQPVVLLHDNNHFLKFSKILAKCRALSKNDRN